MSPLEPTRRRFIAIAAAMTATAMWPRAGAAAMALHEWRGVALGAAATIRLAHPDEAAARRLLDRCATEIVRLERIFSLYRPDSALCRLNAAGALDLPPFELVELLGRAAAVSAATDGVFDATVQPLWRLYAEHFSAADADPAGPAVEAVLPLVGWRGVSVDDSRITLARPGMALTLNGIAQGYITDCVVGLLGTAGVENCLVDMGEIRARGRDGDRSWQVEIETSSGKIASGISISLLNRAMATSGALGFHFDQQGRYNHLFDPSTGTSASPARTVTVIADTAAMADALSTAIALMDEKRIESTLSHSAGAQVYITTADYTRMITGAP